MSHTHGAFDVHIREDGADVWFRLLWRDAAPSPT